MVKRSVLCPCGGDIFESTYAWDGNAENPKPTWKCANCHAETPRKSSNRRTNRRRAIDAYLALREAWKPVDEALDALVAEGKAMGGAIFVHSSTFNWHLKQLSNKDKPSNWDVRYHTAQAKVDMATAQAFIIEKRAA